MKKILIIIFALFTIKVFEVDKSTTFNNEIFQKAQLEGKTVVINSWNETCTTCKAQIKILDQAEKEFKNVLFLSFEQTKDKDIAKALNLPPIKLHCSVLAEGSIKNAIEDWERKTQHRRHNQCTKI